MVAVKTYLLVRLLSTAGKMHCIAFPWWGTNSMEKKRLLKQLTMLFEISGAELVCMYKKNCNGTIMHNLRIQAVTQC